MVKRINVIVLGYNLEKIISQSVMSVLSQKTQFDFDIIIGEDCSLDNTLAVVLELKNKYANKIQVITSKKNVGYELNLLRCLKACDAEFIAFCDGDDYWIDTNKLQTQIDFLDNNPEFGVVGTLRNNLMVESNEMINGKRFEEAYKVYSFEEILCQNTLTASTVVFRKKLLDDFFKLGKENLANFKGLYDYSLWMYFSYIMKVAVLKDVTTVYRMSPNNHSQSLNIKRRWFVKKKTYMHFKFYIANLPNIDAVVIKKSMYAKAKQLYILVANNNDDEVLKDFKKSFKENNDFIRYILLLIVRYNPKYSFIANNYEKIKDKLKHILSENK